MSVRDKLNSDYYENKHPYPDRVSKRTGTPEQHEAYKIARNAYNAETRRLEDEFKADALEETGLAGHPKADKAYDLAWSHGHGSGLHEVLGWLEEYADLLLD